MTTVADGLFQYGGMPVGFGIPPFVSKDSKVFFVDPVNGLDGNPGTAKLPFATLYKAHKMCTAGQNDVVFLVGNGALSGAAVLTAALSVAVDSSLTTGELIWSKAATHLIGIASPSQNSRAKITTVYDRDSTTYTMATFGSTNFMTVSANGCYFQNVSIQSPFSTGNASAITLTVSGSRNVFYNCQIFGAMDTASAQGTDSRSLKVGSGGSGENVFIDCQIGQDTVTRTVANASLELAGGTPRNKFLRCVFPVQTSSADVHVVLGTGNACIDRWNLFSDCWFLNNVKSTSTTADDAISFSTAAPGGMLVLANCNTVGFTKIGDTNGLANTYVSNVGGAATDGLMLAPT